MTGLRKATIGIGMLAPPARAWVSEHRMSLVVIFGPPAVGKAAVGHELQRLTGLRLFHNHTTLELVLQFFAFGDPAVSRRVGEMRRRIMEEVAASDLPGLIFTYVWAFDDPRDRRAVDEFADIFARQGRAAYFVELETSQAERIRRNDSAFRLAAKPSKRDTVASLARLKAADAAHELNSTDEFEGADRYLRIDNTDLSPLQAATAIADAFGLTARDGRRAIGRGQGEPPPVKNDHRPRHRQRAWWRRGRRRAHCHHSRQIARCWIRSADDHRRPA